MSNVNIPVPFFSQRDNSFIWKYRYEKDTEVNEIKYKKGAIGYQCIESPDILKKMVIN